MGLLLSRLTVQKNATNSLRVEGPLFWGLAERSDAGCFSIQHSAFPIRSSWSGVKPGRLLFEIRIAPQSSRSERAFGVHLRSSALRRSSSSPPPSVICITPMSGFVRFCLVFSTLSRLSSSTSCTNTTYSSFDCPADRTSTGYPPHPRPFRPPCDCPATGHEFPVQHYGDAAGPSMIPALCDQPTCATFFPAI